MFWRTCFYAFVSLTTIASIASAQTAPGDFDRGSKSGGTGFTDYLKEETDPDYNRRVNEALGVTPRPTQGARKWRLKDPVVAPECGPFEAKWGGEANDLNEVSVMAKGSATSGEITAKAIQRSSSSREVLFKDSATLTVSGLKSEFEISDNVRDDPFPAGISVMTEAHYKADEGTGGAGGTYAFEFTTTGFTTKPALRPLTVSRARLQVGGADGEQYALFVPRAAQGELSFSVVMQGRPCWMKWVWEPVGATAPSGVAAAPEPKDEPAAAETVGFCLKKFQGLELHSADKPKCSDVHDAQLHEPGFCSAGCTYRDPAVATPVYAATVKWRQQPTWEYDTDELRHLTDRSEYFRPLRRVVFKQFCTALAADGNTINSDDREALAFFGGSGDREKTLVLARRLLHEAEKDAAVCPRPGEVAKPIGMVLEEARERGIAGWITGLIGDVRVIRIDGTSAPATAGMKIYQWERVVTGKEARARLELTDVSSRSRMPDGGGYMPFGSSLYVGPNSDVTVRSIEPCFEDAGMDPKDPSSYCHPKTTWELIRGRMRVWLRGWGLRGAVNVRAGTSVIGIRGTEFILAHDPARQQVDLSLLEGKVELSTPAQSEMVAPGQSVTVTGEKIGAPSPLDRSVWDHQVAEVAHGLGEPASGSEAQVAQGAPPDSAASKADKEPSHQSKPDQSAAPAAQPDTAPQPSPEPTPPSSARDATPLPSEDKRGLTPEQAVKRLTFEALQARNRSEATLLRAMELADGKRWPDVSVEVRGQMLKLVEDAIGDLRTALAKLKAITRDYPETADAKTLSSGGEVAGLSIAMIEKNIQSTQSEVLEPMAEVAKEQPAPPSRAEDLKGLTPQQAANRLAVEARRAFNRAEAAYKRGEELQAWTGAKNQPEVRQKLRDVMEEVIRELRAALEKLQAIIRDYPETDHAVTLIGGGEVAGLSIASLEKGLSENEAQRKLVLEEMQRLDEGAAPRSEPKESSLPASISQTTAALRERTYQAVVQITATKAVAAQPPSASSGTAQPDNIPGPIPGLPEDHPLNEFFKNLPKKPQGQSPPADGAKPQQTTASGFVIDASGLIVTTNALVDGAEEISVELHDGTKLSASVQGRDPRTDLALIKVEPKSPLSALRFGDSEKVKPGDWVAAMGSPFGLKGSITSGIVSATDRESPSGPYDVIQSDVRTSAGYGGGPLLNAEGEVIGVNSMIYAASGTPVGISFATPANVAASVVEQLKQYGEVRRGWLGAKTAVVTSELAQSVGLGEKRGALLEAITPGAPAATADLKPGDIVLAIDDRPVKDSREFARRIGEFPPEAEVRLRVWRDRGEREVVVRLGQIPKRGASAPEGKRLTLQARLEAVPGGESVYRGSLGVKIWDVDGALAKALNLSEPATLVTEITPGSAAQAAGVQAGDTVLSVNARKIESAKDLARTIRGLLPGSEVSLEVWRIGDGTEDFKGALQARAESGDIPAITALGELHHTGSVVSKDLREAARLYRKAAEAGDAEAMKYLGGMYEEGSGVEKNVVEAARLYLKAAEAGDAEAMGLYGVKYLYGNGVPQNDAEAVKWFQRGAGDGDARSMRNLARMYDQGRGLGKDPGEAARLMLEAIKKGEEGSLEEMQQKSADWSADFRRGMQRRLKEEGRYDGPIDGKFGPGVKRAVDELAAAAGS